MSARSSISLTDMPPVGWRRSGVEEEGKRKEAAGKSDFAARVMCRDVDCLKTEAEGRRARVAGDREDDSMMVDPDTFQLLSFSEFDPGHPRSAPGQLEARPRPIPDRHRQPGRLPQPRTKPPPPPRPTRRRPALLGRLWARHRAPILVLLAQFFGVTMNFCARLLEHSSASGKPMHPFQILFVRHSVTLGLGNAYMWWRRTPHFPLGAPGVRRLLVLRGFAGFWGLYGMWKSLTHLPLAEATVITFLMPSVAAYMCHVAMREPFTHRERIAALVAFVGIVLVARPRSLFAWAEVGPASSSSMPPGGVMAGNSTLAVNVGRRIVADVVEAAAAATTTTAETAASAAVEEVVESTTGQRLGAVAMGLVGVVGTAIAIMCIRWMGERAHPLVSINYFSAFCTGMSAAALMLAPALNVGQPELHFELPHRPWEWFLLMLITFCGFMAQFLSTLGLSIEQSNRATMMVYTSMLIAAGYDKLIWGLEMGVESLVGCVLIIGGAMWAALAKKGAPPPKRQQQQEEDLEARGSAVEGEAVPMLGEGDESDDEETEEESSCDDDDDGRSPVR